MMKSLISVSSLIKKCRDFSISTCGICDENLYGVMEFYRSCMEAQIKPIIGLEIELNHIPFYLYARNYDGYLGLLKIHTKKEKGELGIIDIEMYQESLNVVLPYAYLSFYSTYQNHFSHFYIGYTTEYEKNNAYLVTEHVVFCPDLKCFQKNESYFLNMLTAIDKVEPYGFIEKKDYEKNSWEYALEEFMEDASTDRFIESIDIHIPEDKRYIPKYDKNQSNSFLYLEALSKKGLTKRCHGMVTKEYSDRLHYELSVIEKMGFSDYFLIVYDYVLFAKKHGILVGAGRGSAVGSLVSYSLGITDVDPLKYHLLFERFLNPERVTMPDIDIDFEETRRGEVVEYVKERYGKENVANIITFGTLKSKLVLRSVGKALEMNQNVMDHFLSFIDAKLTLKENLENEKIKYYVENNKDIQKMVRISLKLEGLKKHISTHAAGIVISSKPLDEIIPIHYSGEEMLTGITMNYLEDLGLLKMDFLSLRNLTTMANILKLIEQSTGHKVSMNQIDLNDSKVLHLFQVADTVGVFQFESEGMKNFLRQLKPHHFSDIVAAIALFRPGPMENIPTFIKRKDGKEAITYLHPVLEPILKETYGIIVYQEQVMQILSLIGGFSFAEADVIRRAMSKKKRDVIENGRDKFIHGAIKKGYDGSLAQNIYELILKFANFGFNKSHSVSYAMIGYQMAYLKCYYPVYYIANLLNMNVDSTIKTREYIALAKKHNITILPISIQDSELDYKICDSSLRLPFSIIKNLGGEAAKTITLERAKKPYQDFFDFVARTYGKSVTKKTIEALIHASAFSKFGYNHNTLLNNLDNAINYATLASDLDEAFVMKPEMVLMEDVSPEEKRKEEYETYGFYITNHPASKYLDPSIMKLEDMKQNYDKRITCVVMIEKMKEITTKNQEKMAFVTASDETDVGNFVVFASSMRELEGICVGDVVHVMGRVARRFSDYQINVSKIEKIGMER